MASEFGLDDDLRGDRGEPLDDAQLFGINSAQVWIYLDELRALDLDRAVEVWDNYAGARIEGYAAALAAAEHVADRQRARAWARARQAASLVARKALGDQPVTGEVVAVLADVAGAIVVRDLLARRDYRLLQQPWRKRGDAAAASAEDVEEADADGAETADEAEPAQPRGWIPPPIPPSPASIPADWVPAAAAPPPAPAAIQAPAPASAAPAPHLAPPAPEQSPSRPSRWSAVSPAARSAKPAAAVGSGSAMGRLATRLASSPAFRSGARALTAIAVVTVLAVVTRAAPGLGPAGTDPPSLGGVVLPSGSLDPRIAMGQSPSPGASGLASHPPRSGPTAAPIGPTPAPGQTHVPPTAAPATPVPPPPAPTPRPTATPSAMCTVINLVDVATVKAQQQWTDAGFTGTVTFSPAVPPQYRIVWQSLNAGDKVTCSHGITVSNHAP